MRTLAAGLDIAVGTAIGTAAHIPAEIAGLVADKWQVNYVWKIEELG